MKTPKPETAAAPAPAETPAASPASPAPAAASPAPANQPTRAAAAAAAADLDWLGYGDGDVSDESSRIVFPSFYWMNGEPKARGVGGPLYTGGFFLPADSGLTPAEGSPWVAFERSTNEGKVVPGFVATSLRVTFLRYRASWLAPEPEGRARRFAWNDYDSAVNHAARIGKKPRGNVEALLHVEGLPGVVACSVKGTASMGVTDRNGWLGVARRNLSDPANRFAREAASKKHAEATAKARAAGAPAPEAPKVSLPLLRFWFRFGVATKEDGSPDFVKVGEGSDSSFVTRPVVKEPATPCATIADVNRFALPAAVFRVWESEYRSAEPWLSEWGNEALALRNFTNGPGIGTGDKPAPTYGGGNGSRPAASPPPELPPVVEDSEDGIPF